jgi:TRAP-type C4-dicarboxylate transport system permease small subunit
MGVTMAKKILDKLEKVLLLCIGFLLAVMVVTIFYQVVLRYVFHSANTWSEELARYSVMWIVMLGSPIATRRHKHITVTLFIEKISVWPRRALQLFMYIGMLIFLVVFFRAGLIMTINGTKQFSPGLYLNMGIMYFSTIIGAVLLSIYIVEDMIKTVILPAYTDMRDGGRT